MHAQKDSPGRQRSSRRLLLRRLQLTHPLRLHRRLLLPQLALRRLGRRLLLLALRAPLDLLTRRARNA
jgi:hypothetical protein